MFHVHPLSYNHYFVEGNTGAYTPINMAKLGSWLVPWESGRPTLSRDCDFWIPPSWTYGGTYGCPQDTRHSVGMLHAVGMYVVAVSCVRLSKSRSSCIRRPDLNLSPWYFQLWPSAELAAGSRSKWAVVKSLLQICLWGLSNVIREYPYSLPELLWNYIELAKGWILQNHFRYICLSGL